MTTWVALIILALGAMLLILNESGMIAGLDTATFGYVAMFSALIVYLSGGVVGGYRGRADALLRDIVIWLALGLGTLYLRTGKGLLLKLTCELAEVSWFSGIRAGPLQAITLIHEPSHDSARI